MIPEAAVEEAARAMSANWKRMHTNEALGFQRMLAEYALEAAAPHMLAEAWDAAITEANERHMIGGSDAEELKEANPYRTAK